MEEQFALDINGTSYARIALWNESGYEYGAFFSEDARSVMTNYPVGIPLRMPLFHFKSFLDEYVGNVLSMVHPRPISEKDLEAVTKILSGYEIFTVQTQVAEGAVWTSHLSIKEREK